MNKVIHCAVRRDLSAVPGRPRRSSRTVTGRARPRCTGPGPTSTPSSPTTTRASTRSPGRRCRRSASTRQRRSTTFDHEHEPMAADLRDRCERRWRSSRGSATSADAEAAGAADGRRSTRHDHLPPRPRGGGRVEPLLLAKHDDHPAIKEMGKQFSRRIGHRCRPATFFAWLEDGATRRRRRPGCGTASPGRSSTIIGGLFGRATARRSRPVWASVRLASDHLSCPIGWGPATPIERGDMHIDVHQLDVFVLWGSAVTFLAILAVRVSSRTRLPSLLLYLLMGVALGEAGLGIHFEDAELAHALGFAALVVILAEGGLTTTWQRHPTVDAARACRWRRSASRSASASSPLGAHYLLGLSLGDRGPARRGHVADRRGRGVLGAPRGPAPEAAHRRARGRVRPQRRPDHRPGHAHLDGRARRARRALQRGPRRLRAVAGLADRPGRRLRGGVGDAPRRAARRPASTRWP